ncbi:MULTISPECIES: hypothetical protein [Streptomyces]|uniref:Uncharacterized protein n=1 Tax=Streptomyces tricolor TaxID=68277 RepID=A0ABS9JLM7_9ACTN|nr:MULTISPECIES: hypothetical protein [Streptomyces]MCG0066443.1 hypothetical protein [Streptomyces tricolor]BCM66043.1 hypothetical protein EASAB2608_01377 [Streptomyces sp. EAS-AB2608]CUW27638.1 hypothetical protein TUE45_02365 [Streptomyces reticuli]
MITVQFTVRPGQGDASGFDLGDMTITGDLGTAGSAGHVPDQGMMIYLSVVQLLDSLGDFLRGNVRVFGFTAADSSFRLVVRRTKDGLSVASEDGVVARTTAGELASAVLHAAEDLARALPPEDPVASDVQAALAAFRPLVPGGTG